MAPRKILIFAAAAGLTAAALTGLTATTASGAGPEDVRLKKIGNFDAPIYVTGAPGDGKRVFVVERAGRVLVLKKGKLLGKPLLNITKKTSVDAERGLLSIAFSPKFANNRKLYANYTDKDGHTRIAEYKVKKDNPNRVKNKSARTVMKIKQPYSNHNGGQIQFGPDGYLYIGMGDGGSAGDPDGYAQNMKSLLGKMLRIDPRAKGNKEYRIPSDNPFVGKSGVKPQIYSSGLRNPWRFSFDADNGALTIGDVGQNKIEEIDYTPVGEASGANFGWPILEGTDRFSDGSTAGLTPPVIEVDHSEGWCSITGGYVVRDPKSSAFGNYLYGDFCAGEIRSAVLAAGGASQERELRISVPSLVSFGEDSKKRVYVVSLSGAVYRLVG